MGSFELYEITTSMTTNMTTSPWTLFNSCIRSISYGGAFTFPSIKLDGGLRWVWRESSATDIVVMWCSNHAREERKIGVLV